MLKPRIRYRWGMWRVLPALKENSAFDVARQWCYEQNVKSGAVERINQHIANKVGN